MIKKLFLILLVVLFASSCSVFKGVEGVNGRNGKITGGSPSRELRTGIKKSEKRQKRQYDRTMKKRAKRMGTTKKR